MTDESVLNINKWVENSFHFFFFLEFSLCADMKLISNSTIRPKFAPYARGDKLNLQNHVRVGIQATAPAPAVQCTIEIQDAMNI